MIAGTSGNSGVGWLSVNGDTGVETATLDAFVEQRGIGRVDFIKIDIEGAEILCLRGARKLIQRDQPAMLVEVNPACLSRFGASAQQLGDELLRLGYSLHVPTWRGTVPFDPATLGPQEYVNVLALPARAS